MEGVSTRKVCCASAISVAPTYSVGLENCRRILPCSFVETSSAAPISNSCWKGFSWSAGQVCSMRASPHSLGSVATKWGVVESVSFLYGRGNSSKGEQRYDLRFRLSFSSLSRLAQFPSRIADRKLEARLSNGNDSHPEEKRVSVTFRESVADSAEVASPGSTSTSVSPPPFMSQRGLPVNLAAGVGITAAVCMMAVLGFMAKPRASGGGSVSDLIRRGQVRSDRGADSNLLNYEDPFNNPLFKIGTKNPIVRMCGKIFRLAPVTLTDEKVTRHQNRRIQAYRWKRPSVFLNDGDPVPEGVDPEEVRWIPSNHPFATTNNYIDEDLAQKNVYQTRGVPSRVRAEHDALRKKMAENAQREPEFQLPSMEFSGDQIWKASNVSSEETSNSQDSQTSDTVFDKQVNGKGGANPSSMNGHFQDGGSLGKIESRLRTIDFSGEAQGTGRDQ